MDYVSASLLALAYVLAVVDGTLQDKGTYPSSPGRIGFRAYARGHPWLLVGAACGLLGLALTVACDG